MFNSELLKHLVCPVGKKELKYDGSYLICTNCGLKFPIIDDIPVMIVDEAIFPEGLNNLSELACMQKGSVK